MRSRLGKTGTLLAFTLLSACGGDKNAAPVAEAADFSSFEDQSVVGQLKGSDPEGQALTYAVVSENRGKVTSLSNDGTFSFEPETDFYGTAGFVFSVTDDQGLTDRATVLIAIENVNDPPRLAAIPDMTNSPETEALLYEFVVIDPDPKDEHSFHIAAADPTIVNASLDEQPGRMVLKALRLGSTRIEVTVSDTEYSDAAEFTFSAEEVRKARVLHYADTATGAVVLRNETDLPIDFVLEHNGFPVFEDVESMAEYVKGMTSEFEGEDFPRKLWRFLRDSVYHELPIETNFAITDRIFYDPWFTLNSLGWGLCGHVAGAYVLIAEAGGYEARVWGLEGHVVPEIKVNGAWRMYDPDLAVYYKNSDGQVASIADLEANPWLITAPVDPIFAGSSYQLPYLPAIADIYASTSNNFDGANVFLPRHETPSSRIVLPAHARLTYPGRWTAPPTGRDGALSYGVRAYRQALIELQPGWSGQVQLPWMAWKITGSGQVGIEGEFFSVGSPELDERLRNTPAPVTSIDVYANDGIQIVVFINAVRFDIQPRTSVLIRGFNVWGVSINEVLLPSAISGGGELDELLRKPVPSISY